MLGFSLDYKLYEDRDFGYFVLQDTTLVPRPMPGIQQVLNKCLLTY